MVSVLWRQRINTWKDGGWARVIGLLESFRNTFAHGVISSATSIIILRLVRLTSLPHPQTATEEQSPHPLLDYQSSQNHPCYRFRPPNLYLTPFPNNRSGGRNLEPVLEDISDVLGTYRRAVDKHKRVWEMLEFVAYSPFRGLKQARLWREDRRMGYVPTGEGDPNTMDTKARADGGFA